MSENAKILWADDEIDLLRPYILFLEEKGYKVETVNNGQDAIDQVQKIIFDIVILDENMPGIPGLETLEKIKTIYPNLPIIMVTKSEEEAIMDNAIGSKISDYLIKPVNPNQLLLSLKKNLENKRLISEKVSMGYQQDFRHISMAIDGRPDYAEWVDIYKKIIHWELELDKSGDEGLNEILKNQKEEANKQFCNFYEANYQDWVSGKSAKSPILSPSVMKNKVLPLLAGDETIFMIIIDNLRFDQWKMLQPLFEEYFHVADESIYYSILPSCTQYSRNALFAGLMPSDIGQLLPEYWVDDDEEGHKNQYEPDLIREQLKRNGKDVKFSYNKVLNFNYGKKLQENVSNFFSNKLNVIVYNFVDMLSHARTNVDFVKELAEDESAYRSLTASWFEHSQLFELIKKIAEKKVKIVITTDHGSVKVTNPVRVTGDKSISTNLRYKIGRNMQYNPKEVFEMKAPGQFHLPKVHLSSTFIYTRANDFFVYPNNYNHFATYYKNTFQHGGISMEEILIPLITLTNK
ncbi:MAG: bifunctional response regulator/alkaline phosphatase family protein [Bacteroidota bacterium]